jgi:hypothetical protein
MVFALSANLREFTRIFKQFAGISVNSWTAFGFVRSIKKVPNLLQIRDRKDKGSLTPWQVDRAVPELGLQPEQRRLEI